MSNFPDKLDTDAELPLIVDGASEISAGSLNAIRAAIFAIEAALGTGIEGSQQNLSTRLNAVLNSDGTFKSSALVASGLIALPITNAMVGSSAGIQESKLDLDFATQVLQNEINSNDIDIAVLQQAIEEILNKLAEHFAGVAFKHDGYAINLDNNFPNSTPGNFAPLVAVNLSDAIIQLKEALFDHISTTASAAHKASNVSVDRSILSVIDPTNVQNAIEQLEQLGSITFIDHRDDMHANGFSRWSNAQDGYNGFLQKVPSAYGTTSNAFVQPIARKVITFSGSTLSVLGVQQGDVVVVSSPTNLVGNYIIDDIGPRTAIGSRSALDADQLEIVETFPSDGYVVARIFGPSSLPTLKGNLAPTIYQIDTHLDSLQVARPNAARVISLGANPQFLTSSSSFQVEVGIGSSTSRTITVNGLNLNRSSTVVSQITLDSIVERINHVFQNKNDGYAFPAAAYRVGDEIMLAHNWSDSVNHYVKISSSGASAGTLFFLGLDGYGANSLDQIIRPSHTSSFYVSGREFNDLATVLSASANVVGQTFTFPNGENPIASGVRAGHLLQLFNHPNTSECGTYYITNVSTTSITIHKVAGITTASNLTIKVMYDAIALDELANNGKNMLIEAFVDSNAQLDYNIRLDSERNIPNLSIVDVSDNFLAASFTLRVESQFGGNQLDLGIDALPVLLPGSFVGQASLSGSSNIESLKVNISGSIIVGTNEINVYDHINEEEVLEVCSVSFDGNLTLSSIVDKRLFGTIGIDEVREDVVLNYVETPLADLRSNGVVNGLEVIEDNFQDIGSFGSSIYGVLIRGGSAYVEGAKVVVPTSQLMIPTGAASYVACLNNFGSFQLLNESSFSLGEIIDGYFPNLTPIARIINSGAGSNPITSEDLRFFISDLDSKLDLIVDVNDKMVGNFATMKAALNYLKKYPDGEKSLLRVVSYSSDGIFFPSSVSNVNLQLDGKVGNVELDTSSSVYSLSPSDRSNVHIDGYFMATSGATNVNLASIRIGGSATIRQVANSKFNANKCRFDSTVNIASVSDAQVVFENCTFNGSISVSGGTAKFINCIFNGSFSNSAGDMCVVLDCIFNNRIYGTYSANFTDIRDSVFNGNTDGYLLLTNNAVVSGCLFDTIAQSTGSVISIATGSFAVEISECIFRNITLSGTAKIVGGNNLSTTKFISNVVNTATFTSNIALSASIIKNNLLLSATNNMIVECVGDASFVGNEGIHVVQVGTSTLDRLTLVGDNIFPQNSIGYCVNATMPSGQVNPHMIISGNVFRDIITGNSAILCDSTTTTVQIVGNYFVQATSNSGTGINLANASGNLIIADNLFHVNIPFSYANPIDSVSITGNQFLTSSSVSCSLQLGIRFQFTGNISSGVLFVLTGTAPQQIIVAENIFTGTGSLTINASIDDAHITHNRINTLVLGVGGLTNSIISGNRITTLSATGPFSMLRSAVIDNTFNTSIAFENLTWSNSTFSNNQVIAFSTLTFDLGANNTLSVLDNRFNNNTIIFTANSSLDTLLIRDNLQVGSIIASLPLSNALVEGNDGYICFAGGTASSIFSKNFGTNAMALYGNISNTTIVNNQLSTLTIDPAVPSTGNVVSGNNTTGDFLLFVSAGSLEFNNSTISNNVIGGRLGIATTAPGPTANYNLTKTSITNNRLASPISAVINNFIDCTISGNQADAIEIQGNFVLNCTMSYNNTAKQFFVTLDNSILGCDMSFNKIATGNFLITAPTILEHSYFRGNFIETGSMTFTTSSFFQSIIDGNNVLVGDIDLTAISPDGMILSNNSVNSGNIILPTLGAWTGASHQSKALFNYAHTWGCGSGTLTTSGLTFLFPWGNTNTSGNASVVNFDGATSRTVANSNNVNSATNGGRILI